MNYQRREINYNNWYVNGFQNIYYCETKILFSGNEWCMYEYLNYRLQSYV